MMDWEKHYSNGGNSGGHSDEERNWKIKILLDNGFCSDQSIIDVGCGDMTFWKNWHLMNYTGIDISCFQINENRKYHPDCKFYCANSASYIESLKSDVVICFNVLPHIMNEADYVQTLLNFIKYSKSKIFIYTWGINPFDSFINKLIIRKPFGKNVITDDKYQYYRNFKEFSNIYLEKEFNLINTFTNKKWKYGTMYCYEKK